MALGKEVATQAVSNLPGIDLVVFLLRRCDCSKHKRVSNLRLFRMWKQVVVDPSREDRRLHSDHPGLRQRLYPGIQFTSRRSNLAFLVDMTSSSFTQKLIVFL